MYSKRTLLVITVLTTSILVGRTSHSFGQQLRLDTQIETPARNNNVLELPEKQAGETIQFQLFIQGAAGRQIQGYTVELALTGKTFGSYIDDVSGVDWNSNALLSRVSGTGNPTLSMLSLSAVAVPAGGYLGQVNLRISRSLTSSDVLAVQSASTAGPGGVQNLDVAQAVLSLTQAPACPGDFNGDGMVNLADFLAFAGAFGTRSGDVNYDARMDMDGSGAINLSDFLDFAGVFGTTCPTPPSPPVSIPDANLRSVIEDSLGKARGAEITRAEMASLTKLEAERADISNLTGLEYATNLAHLELRFNEISDVSSLSGLSNLLVLYLGDNRIADLSPLSGLTNLRTLWLFDNGITDVQSLSALSNLKELDLAFNGFSDVSPLSGLTDLTTLVLDVTNIADVSPLSGLTNLEELGLSYTSISDVSPLSGLTNLRALGLQSCRNVSDFSPLAESTGLEELYLSDNSITDLSPLSPLTSLTLLFLDNNGLSDLRPLSGLTALKYLYLYNNRITDVSALSGLTNLHDLQLQDNRILDLAPLVANSGLGPRDKVDVKGNPLSATSINVHVPALEAKGVRVSFEETIVFTEPRIYNDNVFVLPVTENLAAGNLPLEDYATRFYTYFRDAFDFLVFFPSLSWSQLDADAFKGAFYDHVGNDVKGIGEGDFFNDRWGSAGRLQGSLFFANVSISGWEHSRLVQGPMLHELMHRWANHIVEPAVPHWDFTSADGILGGFDIAKLVDRGGGRYSAPNVYTGGWALNLKPYSPIELYLAGLIPPEQVPDLWVAEDGEIVKYGRGDAPDDFTARRVKTITVEDIIAEHGPRVPDHSLSQKAFRAAVILLVSEDYPAVRKSLEALSKDANLFSHDGEDQFDEWYNFYEATGGRATIAMDGLSRFKGSGASKRPAVRSFGTPPPPIVCHLEH
ncbi:MAG: leucine-rich repeat domain-containing protein [Gemmatimonadota bacterium]|nr:leucine-rich repeat domain-containing protein [Gemmatimonadota bacterium]